MTDSWQRSIRILAWYVHLSYLSDPNWRPDRVGGWWFDGSRLGSGKFRYDPDRSIGHPNPGLREDAVKDLPKSAGRCLACGQSPASDDHIVATSDRFSAGDNSPWNFAPLCRGCNSRKGVSDLLEWTLRQYGRAFWMEWTDAEGGFVIGGGGLKKEVLKKRDRAEGWGRNLLRLYMFSRWSALDRAGLLGSDAPSFFPAYLRAVEAECRIPPSVVAAVRWLSPRDLGGQGNAAKWEAFV